MDVKKLLKCPEALSDQSAAPLTPETAAAITSLSEKYRETAETLKSLRLQKNRVAAQFRHSNLSEQNRHDLKHAMQDISQMVKVTEQALRQITVSAQTLTEEAVSEPELPGQFQPPTEELGKPLTFQWLTADSEQWHTFVQDQNRHRSQYHHPAFSVAIKECFGYDTQILAAYCEGKLVGGLPVSLLKSPLFGKNAVSMPYFNYGGPLTPYKDVLKALTQQPEYILEQTGSEQLELRTTSPGLGSDCSDKKVSMILSLPGDEDTLDHRLGAKVRAQVKQASHHAPSKRFGGIELLDDFYEVFARNMRDLGTPVYSKQWFASLLQSSEINSVLIVCYVSGQPVGTGFLCGHNDTLEIPWASTLKSVNNLNINMWMYRQILGYAIEQRYQFFDFGRSSKEAGTYRFKKQWGAKPIQHYWYYYRTDDKPAGTANPDNPRYRLVIAVWKRLPVWLTKIIGPSIVRGIP